MTLEEKRQLALDLAKSLLWRPYVWGGDDPILGYDCSGYIIEILRSVGLLPQAGDWSAHDLWLRLSRCRVPGPPYAGCIIYWARSQAPERAIHCELAISDELSIGASGGGAATTSLRAAAERNAYVRIRPIEGRGAGLRLLGIQDPWRGNCEIHGK